MSAFNIHLISFSPGVTLDYLYTAEMFLMSMTKNSPYCATNGLPIYLNTLTQQLRIYCHLKIGLMGVHNACG